MVVPQRRGFQVETVEEIRERWPGIETESGELVPVGGVVGGVWERRSEPGRKGDCQAIEMSRVRCCCTFSSEEDSEFSYVGASGCIGVNMKTGRPTTHMKPLFFANDEAFFL